MHMLWLQSMYVCVQSLTHHAVNVPSCQLVCMSVLRLNHAVIPSMPWSLGTGNEHFVWLSQCPAT